MNERIVYLGSFNNGKKEELIEKALSKLKDNKGDSFYYLLPNGELLTSYRKKFIDRVEKAFEINLYTFDNIVKNILEGNIYININNSIKDLILKEIVYKLDSLGKIKYYKDFIYMEGFIQSLNGIIGEIKRSLVYPKDYMEKSPKTPYYEEIGLIYKEYEEYLYSNNLIDREGSFFKAIEILKNSPSYFRKLDFVIIDEFYDFRPIEIAILKELCKFNVDIYINIPFDMKNRLSNIDNTLKILKNLGFDLEYIEKKEYNFFEDIGFNLFNNKKVELKYNENLKLIKAPSIYLEIKKIFEEIKILNRNGVALEEIALVLLSDDYKDDLFEVAEEEKTPISLRKEISLKEIPLIREFLNLIRIKLDVENKQPIINRIKSNYFSLIEYDLRNGLEFILRKLKFNNLEELTDLFNESKSLNIPIEYMDPIKDISKKLKEEMSLIKEKDSIENYSHMFIQLINQYNLEEEIYNRYRNNKNYDLLHRDISSLEKLKEILVNMKEINIIIKEISIEDYFETLVSLLRDEVILEQEENIKGIKILSPINSRGMVYDNVFIAGLSQEYYPKLKESNFFINDENHVELKNIGLNVLNYYERLNNETIKFATLISSCNKRLYLSFSQGIEGDDISSIFLDEILSLLPGDELEEKLDLIEVDLAYLIKEDIEKITTINELSNYLILNQNENLSSELKDYIRIHNNMYKTKFESINSKIFAEFKRQEKDFNEYSGNIMESEILKNIEKEHRNKVYSNTYLEDYSKCPYYFLLKRILGVEEMERVFQEYKPMDIGNIYHEVLRHYYYIYMDNIVNYVKGKGDFLISETLENLKKLVYKYSGEYGLKKENKKDLLIIENTYDRLEEFIESDLKRMSNPKEKVIPYGLEVEFGLDNDFSLDIDGEKIKIMGKIDRIDKLLNEEKYIIMDYKSSEYGIYNISEMEEGLSLQLPIYAMSQEDKNIVAGLYGIITKADFQTRIGILEEYKLITRRHGGALDSEGWTNLMERTKSNIKNIKSKILKGDFSVNPLECSKYCIYKNICRYEKILEVE